ncbi:flavin reductase family protein [Dactylosporangium fulvum]
MTAVVTRTDDAGRAGLVDEFRAAFRAHPAGVALIAARGPHGPVGLTVSSVASVSAAPPALSFSLGAGLSARALLAAETFVVHLLHGGSVDLARAFATSGAPRFTADQGWMTLPTGEPALAGAGVVMRCRRLHAVPVGDATLVAAEVLEILARPSGGQPLVYHDRAYHRFDG